jgi:hypothetical protein
VQERGVRDRQPIDGRGRGVVCEGFKRSHRSGPAPRRRWSGREEDGGRVVDGAQRTRRGSWLSWLMLEGEKPTTRTNGDGGGGRCPAQASRAGNQAAVLGCSVAGRQGPGKKDWFELESPRSSQRRTFVGGCCRRRRRRRRCFEAGRVADRDHVTVRACARAPDQDLQGRWGRRRRRARGRSE